MSWKPLYFGPKDWGNFMRTPPSKLVRDVQIRCQPPGGVPRELHDLLNLASQIVRRKITFGNTMTVDWLGRRDWQIRFATDMKVLSWGFPGEMTNNGPIVMISSKAEQRAPADQQYIIILSADGNRVEVSHDLPIAVADEQSTRDLVESAHFSTVGSKEPEIIVAAPDKKAALKLVAEALPLKRDLDLMSEQMRILFDANKIKWSQVPTLTGSGLDSVLNCSTRSEIGLNKSTDPPLAYWEAVIPIKDIPRSFFKRLPPGGIPVLLGQLLYEAWAVLDNLVIREDHLQNKLKIQADWLGGRNWQIDLSATGPKVTHIANYDHFQELIAEASRFHKEPLMSAGSMAELFEPDSVQWSEKPHKNGQGVAISLRAATRPDVGLGWKGWGYWELSGRVIPPIFLEPEKETEISPFAIFFKNSPGSYPKAIRQIWDEAEKVLNCPKTFRLPGVTMEVVSEWLGGKNWQFEFSAAYKYKRVFTASRKNKRELITSLAHFQRAIRIASQEAGQALFSPSFLQTYFEPESIRWSEKPGNKGRGVVIVLNLTTKPDVGLDEAGRGYWEDK
jgi:hypothetical protein